MIRRLLVANRGEIARRVFRTCRELGIATVAVHSDADAAEPFVIEADQAIRLPGRAPADTYLRGDLIVEAACAAGADAVHPGYGFLAENAGFARAVESAGLTWIGPAPEAIASMGSKIGAKQIMAAAGVPVLEADLATVTAADLPLLVKASAGGGGRGMRVVDSLDHLAAQVEQARAEAASGFGDPAVFAEPYLPTARHVEVQILADMHGTIWVLGDRDCSIQRRHQKVVEEAPAPFLAAPTRTALHAFARKAAEAVSYHGVGTVEFLLDRDRIFFLEMNTRLQVEHPVTEGVTGLDLVALAIAVAEGKPLTGPEPTLSGHAIEVRLYAEDPAAGFAGQTGRIRAFDVPRHPGVRVDAAVEAGSEVSVHYDALLAKVIAHADDRDRAIRLLDDTLRRTRLHGVTTNLDLLRAVIADAEFAAGRMHTTLLDERLGRWTSDRNPRALAKAALAAAAGQATQSAAAAPVLSRIPAAWRNAAAQPRRRVYRRGSQTYAVTYSSTGGRLVSDFVAGAGIVDVQGDRVVLSDGAIRQTYRVTVTPDAVDVDGPDGSVSFEPVPVFADPAENLAPGSLVAPMPAVITAVAVEVGAAVRKGDPIVVLEAMKMQHTVTAPAHGTVTRLTVSVGRQVVAGAVLAVVEEES